MGQIQPNSIGEAFTFLGFIVLPCAVAGFGVLFGALMEAVRPGPETFTNQKEN